MPKYRKKPVIVEAVQFTKENFLEVQKFIKRAWGPSDLQLVHCDKGIMTEDGAQVSLIIPTLEGNHRADNGDYIIKGVNGEFYPCKPDIFEKTYEPVE
nr:hypothetical protein [Sporolactobacillus terrae]